MNKQWLTIYQLDEQLKDWQQLAKKYGYPQKGWVKTLRIALSMTAEQLATRLGLTRARINQLENAEIHNAVTLRTLKETANALDCELIYAIVPKNNSTLKDIIENKAEQVANERIANVAHTMVLEAQSIHAKILKTQKDEIVKNLMDNLNKKFWAMPERKLKKKK